MESFIFVDGEKAGSVSSFPISMIALHVRDKFYHRFSKKSREENK